MADRLEEDLFLVIFMDVPISYCWIAIRLSPELIYSLTPVGQDWGKSDPAFPTTCLGGGVVLKIRFSHVQAQEASF